MAQVTGVEQYRRIRLEPDTKAAESLSRRIWGVKKASRSEKNTAGARVYRHEKEE